MIPDEAVEAAAQALRDAFDWGVDGFDEQAKRALEAAAPHLGKPQQVTTVRELRALPDESVVRSEFGAIFAKGGGWWEETGTRDASTSEDIALPATVLHVGGAE